MSGRIGPEAFQVDTVQVVFLGLLNNVSERNEFKSRLLAFYRCTYHVA